MNKIIKNALTVSLSAAIAAAALSGVATAVSREASTKLLTANFESRQVVQVEVGDFHFKPGQIAPIHTHAAPAVGYVAKGQIIYQVEGEAPQLLREGDAFYEPAGPRILRFDNASETEEAVFLDFNLEQAGEPFIVFEKPPTEAIDRRTLPSIDLGGRSVDSVDIYASELAGNEALTLERDEPTLGLVAHGVIEVQTKGNATRRFKAGESFALKTGGSGSTIVNGSAEATAKVITFRLR